MTPPVDDLPGLVDSWSRGDAAALDRLVEIVYPELRAIAHRQLMRERGDHTLNTTALVHEVYLKLAGQTGPAWHGRGQFFALLSKVMRHVLVDYARGHGAAKRGGRRVRVTLRQEDSIRSDGLVELMALDQALERLAEKDERLARVVECRFFGGLREAEIAVALDISERTVIRDWHRARAYLYQMLSVEESERE